MRSVSPSRTPSNCRATPWPTISSRSPWVNARPSTIRSFGRNVKAAGSTPRTVMLEPVVSPVFISSAITMTSAEASGRPSAPWATPGACLMIVPCSREMPELSSAWDPPRSTSATSGRPAAASVDWNPAAIARSAVNTATTPARPTTMTSDAPTRSGMLRRPSMVIDRICFSMPAFRSAAGEGVDDGQALRAQRRQQADGEAQDDDGDGSGHPDLRVDGQREVAARRLRDGDAEGRRDGEAREPADDAERGRLREHEGEHRAILETERLQDCELRDPLAHALRDGVADHEQQREEDRKQDPAHDQADVADLLEEPDVEVPLGLRLGLVRGILEHPVDRRRDPGRVVGVGEPDDVDAGEPARELVGFVEVREVDPPAVRVALPLLVLAVVDTDEVESPRLASVLLWEDVRGYGYFPADLPAVLVGEVTARDHASAGVLECPPLGI